VTGVMAIVAAATLHETAGRTVDARVEAEPLRRDPLTVGE